jgi:hypothetical protein
MLPGGGIGDTHKAIETHAAEALPPLSNSLELVWKMVLVPLLVYGLTFTVLTFPLITRFSSHFFADTRDGLQNVWNIWWVNKSVRELHQLPWHTHLLHYPYGISLLPHTLNPFNGFMAIPLLRIMSLEQAHNVMVIFSFIVGGLTAFLLAYHFTAAYWPSVVGGFIFTFSNFHFAHAQGHLQLVSLEWIPLFLLLWCSLLDKPRVWTGLAVSAALFLVLLCDYYYYFFCVLAGGLVLLWRVSLDGAAALRRAHCLPLAAFAAGCLVSSGPLVGALLWLAHHDRLVGAHEANVYSLDLLAPFIYGGHWRFSQWTQGYWSKLSGNIHESSVHIGLTVLVVAAYACWVKNALARPTGVGLWMLIGGFFAVFSLGPALHIWGVEVVPGRLPYAWLERIFPPLRMSGVPVRMIVMTQLSAALLCAWGLDHILRAKRPGRLVAAIGLGLLLFEYLPAPIPTTRPETPAYVEFVRGLPTRGGIVDLYAGVNSPQALLWQTRHGKPIAFGYVSRVPQSKLLKDLELRALLDSGNFQEACSRFRVSEIVTNDLPDEGESIPGAKTVFRDGTVRVIALDCPALTRQWG